MPVKKILLIDDDEDDQILFVDAVKGIDGTMLFEIGNNGLEALALLRNAQKLPDMIFLDLNMPKMNGYEVLTELANDVVLKAIPVVIYTTSSSQADQLRTQEMGAHYFLTKPSNLLHFESELTKILRSVEAV